MKFLLFAFLLSALAVTDAKKRFVRPGTKAAAPEKPKEESKPMFELPTSHFDDYEHVTELDEDGFESAFKDKDDLWIAKFYLPTCGACAARTDMWKKLGEIFSKVKVPGVHIASVNCGDEGNEGVNKMCTNCYECFKDFPVQNIAGHPTVRGFTGAGAKKEGVSAKWDDITESEKQNPTLAMINWMVKEWPSKFPADKVKALVDMSKSKSGQCEANDEL